MASQNKKQFDCNWLLDQTDKPQRLAIWYDCLSKELCEQFIQKAETSELQTIFKKQRIMWDDPKQSQEMWENLDVYNCLKQLGQHEVQDKDGDTWKAIGLNQRFRLVKYDNNQGLGFHCDAGFEESPTRKTFVTFTIYLNTIDRKFRGQTYFNKSNLNIHPIQGCGMFIWIDDNIEHCAIDLRVPEDKKLAKYILRMDIMYECNNLQNPDIR